jgi:hypothetical protein
MGATSGVWGTIAGVVAAFVIRVREENYFLSLPWLPRATLLTRSCQLPSATVRGLRELPPVCLPFGILSASVTVQQGLARAVAGRLLFLLRQSILDWIQRDNYGRVKVVSRNLR